jgi:uncharacterized protein with FMN-binding domain
MQYYVYNPHPRTDLANQPRTPERHGVSRKVSNGLVALSSAAIIAVYAAGYARTRAAADAFNDADARRRPAPPATEKLDIPDAAPARPQPAAPAAIVTPAPIGAVAEPRATPATPAAEPRATDAATVSAAAPPAAIAATPSSPAVASAPAVPALASAAAAATEAAAPPGPVAAAPTAAPAAAAAAPTVLYKDGTYLGWGHSRHGDIQSFVIIEKGRIVHAGVEKCRTRWPCTLVDHLPPQVVKRQSPDVDFVSGATESGNALYWGIVDALTKAKVDPASEVKAASQP